MSTAPLNENEKQMLSGSECHKLLSWIYEAMEKDNLVALESHRLKPVVQIIKGQHVTFEANSTPERYILGQSVAYGVKPEHFAKTINDINTVIDSGKYRIYEFGDSVVNNYEKAMSVIK